MRAIVTPLCLAFGLMLSVTAQTGTVQAQAVITASCKDGTSFSGTTRSGACRGHGGVQAWDSAAPAKPVVATPAAPAPTAPMPTAAAPAASVPVAAAPEAPKAKTARIAPMPAATAAPGGGPGMVWASAGSKAYHCSGSKWYGKTKKGSYMTEADAKANPSYSPHARDSLADVA